MHDSPPSAGRADRDYAVVVPFFNEQDNVTALLDEIVAAMAGRDYEIVVVDDCSTDATLARLQAGAARLPGVRVVRHAVNRGQSAALCSGADAARARWLVTLDGDGQNDPRDIATLIAAAERARPRPVMVCGHRHQRRDNALRRLSSRVANGVRSRLLGDATPDTGCGLKLIERAAFQRLPRFDHMHRFLPALALRDGGRVMSVEVSHRPRLHGQSKYGLWNRLWVGIVDLAGVMWLRRRAFRHAPAEDETR
ncbi:MAG: glycosyltransferase family 2 protein [Gammaproteobacteria bacterium]|nr:glycosyltransferase family 2 protein [Gammaproteobacteria bacterium]MCP5198398.1 glycosyltransferase family 2 protein [Gammaproteobacteria bacterium]